MTCCSEFLSLGPLSVFSGGTGARKKLCIAVIICLMVLVSTWITKKAYHITKGPPFVSWLNKFSVDSLVSPGHSSPPQAAMTGIDDEYSTRLNRVKLFCKAKQKNSKMCYNGEAECKLPALVIDENNKLIFCAIPKVASTIWKTKLALMTGKDHPARIHVHAKKAIAKYNLFGINAYSKAERAYRMRKYFKFVFVRHPLTRLLSAYREKIEFGTHSYGKQMLPSIMKYLRKNTTDNTSISFEEFASYILRRKGPMAQNPHWAPYNNACHFCEVQYDFIGRQELLENEARYLLQLQFDKPPHGDFNNSMHRTFSDLALARKYYAQLTEETKQGLLHLYGEDMEMFGYKSTDIF